MAEAQVSYEEYIPSDRYTIQDMYFWGIQLLRQDYAKIMRGWYNNQSRDTRAMIEFFADADGFYWFANENMLKFSTEQDKKFLQEVFEQGKADINKVEQARQVFQVLMRFAAKSKLTDLTESRPMGDFAYARQKLGILKQKEA